MTKAPYQVPRCEARGRIRRARGRCEWVASATCSHSAPNKDLLIGSGMCVSRRVWPARPSTLSVLSFPLRTLRWSRGASGGPGRAGWHILKLASRTAAHRPTRRRAACDGRPPSGCRGRTGRSAAARASRRLGQGCRQATRRRGSGRSSGRSSGRCSGRDRARWRRRPSRRPSPWLCFPPR